MKRNFSILSLPEKFFRSKKYFQTKFSKSFIIKKKLFHNYSLLHTVIF